MPARTPSHPHSIISIHGLSSVVIYDDDHTNYLGVGVSAFPACRAANVEAKRRGLKGKAARDFVTDRVFQALVREFGDGVSVESRKVDYTSGF